MSYFSAYLIDTFVFELILNYLLSSMLINEIMKGKSEIIRKFVRNQDLVDFIKLEK